MQLDASGRALSRRSLTAGLAVLLTCGALLAVGALKADSAEAAKLTIGNVTGTLYFSKGETASVTEGRPGASFACGALMPGYAKFVCAETVAWSIQANRAKNRDMCLKIKFTLSPPPAFMHWPDIYGGGYCT